VQLRVRDARALEGCSFVQYIDPVAASAARIAEVLAGLRARSLRMQEVPRGACVPLGLGPLDEALGGGLPRGRVVEVFGPRGSGRLSLAASALKAAQAQGELVSLVDVADAFAPDSVDLDLSRLLWVRPKTASDGLLSIDRILDAGGFGAAVLYLGQARLPERAGARLQRRAEQARCALLVVGDRAQLGSFSAASLSLERTRARWSGGGRAPLCLDGASGRVAVVRNKLGPPGDSAQLDLPILEKGE
jgi:hypothetical protein